MKYLRFKKLWEDDDGLLQIKVSASNSILSTTQDFYIYPEELQSFSRNLKDYFPKLGKGEVILKYGSEVENYYSYVKLRFFYINLKTIGIQVRTNNLKSGLELAVSEFYIETTLDSVNALGNKMLQWIDSKEDMVDHEFKKS